MNRISLEAYPLVPPQLSLSLSPALSVLSRFLFLLLSLNSLLSIYLSLFLSVSLYLSLCAFSYHSGNTSKIENKISSLRCEIDSTLNEIQRDISDGFRHQYPFEP